MKKLVIAGLISTFASISVQAQETGPGCGIGSIIFDGESGAPAHVLAATTNGSFGNQTFGMTSGTLGCDPGRTINYTASVFVDENMENLAVDFSRGEGETLDAFVNLMGIADKDKPSFAAAVRSNFADIFTSEDVSSTEVVDNIVTVMEKDQALSAYI